MSGPMIPASVTGVARALARQCNSHHSDRDEDHGWEEHVDAAKAAIEAMTMPPSGMKDAVEAWLEREGLSMDVSSSDVWRIGIETVLSSGGKD